MRCTHFPRGPRGCDECATDKTEAKEFAYFSGIAKGVSMELSRVISVLRANAALCDFEQMGGAHSNNACPCWYLKAITAITGEHK